MRVFVTGATGFVGSAVVRELIDAGHSVVGLARSDEGARALAEAGAQVHRGDLTDTEGLKAAAAGSDGVIHTGFIHDFSRIHEVCEVDRRAIGAMASALEGSDRPLVVTSGTAMLAADPIATEETPPPTGPDAWPRVATEEAAAAARARGVRSIVVRLPPTVHGEGDRGFVPMLIGIAWERGVSAYVGEGNNRWPAVHRLDAARLYRLAIEKGAAGAVYHGVAEEGIPFREIASVIGRGLGVPVASRTPEEAAEHFGWFSPFPMIDAPASAEITKERLGWRPDQPGLIADVDRPVYFGK